MGNGILVTRGMQGHRYQAAYHLVDYDEVPTEASALGDHLAAALDSYGSKGDYKDCGMERILLGASVCFKKENDKIRPLNFQPKSCSEIQGRFLAAIK